MSLVATVTVMPVLVVVTILVMRTVIVFVLIDGCVVFVRGVHVRATFGGCLVVRTLGSLASTIPPWDIFLASEPEYLITPPPHRP